jgi:hypothetical protein
MTVYVGFALLKIGLKCVGFFGLDRRIPKTIFDEVKPANTVIPAKRSLRSEAEERKARRKAGIQIRRLLRRAY